MHSVVISITRPVKKKNLFSYMLAINTVQDRFLRSLCWNNCCHYGSVAF